jgi:pimeloyl-ACP methyl ester carboxylesterase
LRRFPFIALALLAVVMVGCSSMGDGDSGASQKKQKAPEGTFELPNGRSLYMECRGSGSPTIVVEAGLGMPAYDMSELQKPLARQYMTCTYDRANMGSSGKAPTPRTAGEIVSDLHQLLQTADVAGPYVLVGHSAGGFFVQLYGRRYPDEVVGVVALNAVPHAHPWLERALPRFNKEERKEELAFYRGENDEQIDWLASTKELKKAPPPPPVPFENIISTELQCEGESEEYPGPCLKSYDIYEEGEREVAQQWPEGSYRQVDAYHEIYLEKPGVVIDAVKRVASK